ncbi:ferredoxin-NADP reductase [Paraburkholderia sp. UCT70]
MTRASIDLGLDRDIAFVDSTRTPADIVFRAELQRLAKLSPQLKLIFVCEGIGDESDWAGATGRLGLQQLSEWLPDFKEREVFTCGPAGYMSGVKDLLQKAVTTRTVTTRKASLSRRLWRRSLWRKRTVRLKRCSRSGFPARPGGSP